MFKELIEGKFDGSVADGLDFEKYKVFFASMQTDVEGAITRDDLSNSFMALIKDNKLSTLTSIHATLQSNLKKRISSQKLSG